MLLGRDSERRTLQELFEGARNGKSGILAIVGEAGVGKSALLRDAEERAHGMRVLKARGVQSEAQIPFAGLFELLRPALTALPQLPAPQAAALESALALRPAQAHDRFAIGAATLSLLAAAAEMSPLAVIVDDAHWLDGSTADSLLFAIRRLVADPIAVVLAVREGESVLLDALDVPTLRLRGLDASASRALLVERLSAPVSAELADRLHRQTGGNPLALMDVAEQPRVFEDVVLGAPIMVTTRLARVYAERARVLPERTRDLLVLAAASDSGDLSLLARAAQPLTWDLDELTAAETAALVAVRDGRLEFCHPLARSAIYADANPAQRRLVHRALARVLPDVEVDRRAWHLALAALGPDERASSALEQAGVRARERSAFDVASRAFERGARLAVDQQRQARLLYLAGEASWLAGLTPRATQLLGEARQQAPGADLLVLIDELNGYIATRLGLVHEAQTLLMSAAERAASLDPERAVIMLAEAVNASFYAGDAEAMRRAAERVSAITPPEAIGRTAFFSLIARGMASIFSGDDRRGATLVREAANLLERSLELRNDPRLLAWAAMGPMWLREAGSERELVTRALDLARSQAALGVLPFVLLHVAVDQATTDRWTAARATFEEGIELARETGQRTELAWSLACLARMEARQGRTDAGRVHANEALDLSRRLGLRVFEIWSVAALGELELSLGRFAEALGCFEEMQGLLEGHSIGDADLSAAPELVELYLRLGRRADATTAAEIYFAQARTKGQPWALARAERALGLIASEDEEMESHLETALQLHAQTPDAFETARTRLLYGATLRRGRQRVRAREHLRLAVETFDRLRSDPWSELARRELAATGETARRRNAATLNELTPQELQVALRIAEGRTTRESAAALFLSPKTVEYHLRSVYRKLGIESRAELTAVVRDFH